MSGFVEMEKEVEEMRVEVEAEVVEYAPEFLSGKYRVLSDRLLAFVPKLERSEEVTEKIVRILRDWMKIPKRSQQSAVFTSPTLIASSGAADDFVVDRVKSRSTQIRLRAQAIDEVVRAALPLCERAVELQSRMVEHLRVTAECKQAIAAGDTLTIEALEEIVAERESKVAGSRRDIALILPSIDELCRHPLATMSSKEVDGITVYLSALYETVFVALEACTEDVNALRERKTAADRFFRLASDAAELFEVIDKAVGAIDKAAKVEAGMLINSINGKQFESKVATYYRHCSERLGAFGAHDMSLASANATVAKLEAARGDILANNNRDSIARLAEARFKDLQNVQSSVVKMSGHVRMQLKAREEILGWLKKGLAIRNHSLSETLSRLESGEGWSAVLSEPGDNAEDVGGDNATPLLLESFGKDVDMVVRRWEDDVIMLEDVVDRLLSDGHVIMERLSADDGLAGEVISAQEAPIRSSLLRLQKTFEEQKSGLFLLSRSVDRFVIVVSNAEPLAEELVSVLRNRMFISSPESVEGPHEYARPQTPSSVGGHLVITGQDSIDSQNIRSWMQDHMETERVLQSVLNEKMDEAEALFARVDEQCVVNLRGAGRVLMKDALGRRIEGLRSAYREALRLASDEKSGLDLASRYYHWHTQLGLLEVQLSGLTNRLLRNEDENVDDDELLEIVARASDLRKQFDALNATVATEGRRRRGSAGPISPVDGVSPFGHRENGGMFSAEFPSRRNARRPSTTSLAVGDASDIANLSSWRARVENFTDHLSDVEAEASERSDEISRRRRERLDDQGRLERALTWSSEALNRLDRVGSFGDVLKYLLGEIMEGAESGVSRAVLAAMHESGKVTSVLTSELQQIREEVLGIATRTCAFDEVDSVAAGPLSGEVSAALEHVRFSLIHQGRRNERMKRLYALDRDAADLLTWLYSASSAAAALLEREKRMMEVPDSGEIDEDILQEVEELEERLEGFKDSLTSFMKLCDNFLAGDGEDEAERLRQAAHIKLNQVLHARDALESLVSGLRGSSAARGREIEFGRSADAVKKLLEEIRFRLALVAGGSSKQASDVESATVLQELDGELDGIVHPRLTELREKATTLALTVAERGRYMTTQKELTDEFGALSAWIGRERKDSQDAAKQKEIRRAVDECMRTQAEFAKFLQRSAAAVPRTPTPSSPPASGVPVKQATVAELEQTAAELESTFNWYDDEIKSQLEAIEASTRGSKLEARYQELVRKWKSMTFLKSNVVGEVRRRAKEKRSLAAASAAATKSSIPRLAIHSPSGGMAGAAGLYGKSPSPIRTPSPGSLTSSSPTQGRHSPLHLQSKSSGLPIKILLPTPNHYGM
ncbi:hypothetical protein HK101_009696 [Irineochytrium annulatum]|nr:hypothetical protein HK101_009696 [Irineochytrium annulatum]